MAPFYPAPFGACKGETGLEKYIIHGGTPLSGEVEISGAKNAAVAILPATLVSDGVCVVENVPCISDVTTMLDILEVLGAKVERLDRNTVRVDPQGVHSWQVPTELSRNMRASYYFLGALLTRFGRGTVSLPGGCNLGARPIDMHLKAFQTLGCRSQVEYGLVTVTASGGALVGDEIYFEKASVGATINVMLAAVKARGLTVIEGAAKEPHIVDVANFLNLMGANIRGAGTDTIKIRGVESLRGTSYSIIPDQIEAGTYMAAAAATGGDVLVKNVTPKHLESISSRLQRVGAEITEYEDSVRVTRTGAMRATNVVTMPHPGFPTDMQPQIAVLLALAVGTSIVTESIWDNRFRYVDELRRMGANIEVDEKIAVIDGVPSLRGAKVRATDLRAGAAMIIAGLVADGVTEIEDIYHIERGYEHVVEKFAALGARIERVTDED